MRTPAGGNTEFGAAMRSVIHPTPVFTGSTKLPTNAAPSSSRIVSPAARTRARAEGCL